MKPNLFIVGAQKCGTTSLHRYLECHPDVFMTDQKELGFFEHLDGFDWSDRADSYRQVTTWDAFNSHFKGSDGHRYAGESTSTHICRPGVPKIIHDYNPDARIIIGIRDPIDRAVSAWRMVKRNGMEDRWFAQIALQKDLSSCDYVSRGLYAQDIQRWHDLFGDNLLVYHLEDLAHDTPCVVRSIMEWLDLDTSADIDFNTIHNLGLNYRNELFRRIAINHRVVAAARAVLPQRARSFINERILARDRKPPFVDRNSRAILSDFYQEDQRQLQDVLRRVTVA